MIISLIFPSSSSSASTPLPPTLAAVSHSELVLIELQGELAVECLHDSDREGKLVGTLTMDGHAVRGMSYVLRHN